MYEIKFKKRKNIPLFQGYFFFGFELLITPRITLQISSKKMGLVKKYMAPNCLAWLSCSLLLVVEYMMTGMLENFLSFFTVSKNCIPFMRGMFTSRKI